MHNPDAQKGTTSAPNEHAAPRGDIPYTGVVVTCTVLGALCIVSSVLKTWLSSPVSFDWFVLAMGVLLSGLPLFRRVVFGSKGFEAEIEHLKSQVRQLSSSLKIQ